MSDAQTTFTAVLGDWPHIAMEMTIEDALWLVQTAQEYALSTPYSNEMARAFAKGYEEDLSWVQFEQAQAHSALHFVARWIGADLLFRASEGVLDIDQAAKAGDFPKGINPINWTTWWRGQPASKDVTGPVKLDLRLRWTEEWLCPADIALAEALQRAGDNPTAQRLLAGLQTAQALIPQHQTTVQEEELAQVSQTIAHVQDYGRCWYNQADKHVWWTAGDADGYNEDDDEYYTTTIEDIQQRFQALDFVDKVSVEAECDPVDIGLDMQGWRSVQYKYIRGTA